MTDQMQGRLLDPEHPCLTPNLDSLAKEGVRFRHAYTPNAVCSPARASLMTGLLPHNHGVLHVTHCVDADQSKLRLEHPHWAQKLQQAGYVTGYFGKWHVERTNRLEDFGWSVNGESSSSLYARKQHEVGGGDRKASKRVVTGMIEGPPGYQPAVLYGVTDTPPEERGVGISTALALDFLTEAVKGDQPWCCFVSVLEPHDPYICGREAYDKYDVETLPLPPSMYDSLADKPGLYRKAGRVFQTMNDRQRRELAACYYGSVSEIDEQYGKLIAMLRESDQLDNTVVVFTSDHGELLGAHGLYMKNISAFEEVYRIPLIVKGPGIRQNVQSDARVGLHDVCQTLLELAGCETLPVPDSRSFASLLQGSSHDDEFDFGYAEYHGTRVLLTQRVVWEGPWKYVCNGFDQDELYNLESDPQELINLIDEPAFDSVLRRLSSQMWRIAKQTGDQSLLNMTNPALRIPVYGPDISFK